MLEKKPIMTVSMMRLPAAKLRSPYTLRSRMGSSVVSSRRTKATSVSAASTARTRMTDESNHSWRSPWSRKSCSERKPTAMRTRPIRSMRPGFLRYQGSKSTALATRKPMMPMGRLM
jgi:hypothetical protein